MTSAVKAWLRHAELRQLRPRQPLEPRQDSLSPGTGASSDGASGSPYVATTFLASRRAASTVICWPSTAQTASGGHFGVDLSMWAGVARGFTVALASLFFFVDR